MPDFLFDRLYTGLENVLDLRVQQHALTATNIANADTPGFKAKFIDFERALGEAMDAATPSETAAIAQAEIVEAEAAPWSEDGNSVYAERETARLNENSLMYSALTRSMSSRLAILKLAASGGR